MSRINEGVIDVPDDLVKFVMNKIMKYVGNYIGNNIDPAFYKDIEIQGNSPINTNITYEIDKDDPSAAIGVKYDIDVSNVVYTDKTKDELVIGVHIHNKNHMYLPDSNLIAISVKSLFERLDKVIVKADDPSEQADYYELVGTIDSVNRILKWFYNTLKNVVKHELAHYIQIRYLKHKHEKQAELSDKDESDIDNYYMSNIEYSPQIISAIEVFKQNAPLSKSPTEYFKFLVAINNHGSMVLADDGVDDSQARQFFMALKKNNTTLYKKAVKYLASSI